MTELTFRLIAKRSGSLLPTAINREITIDQANLINRLLDATDGADAELTALSNTFDVIYGSNPHPGGIEQYQDEDR